MQEENTVVEEEVIDEYQEVEEAEAEEIAESEEDAEAEEVDSTEELFITLDDGETPAPEKEAAPEWVKDLRKNYREQQKENKALKKQLEEISQPKQVETLGEKPTFEGCDCDADVFEKELSSYHEKKKALEAKQAVVLAEQEKEQQEWQKIQDSYTEEKESINLPDFDDAEFNVQESLSVTQQGIILQAADKPAHVVAALGNNPNKLKELAGITNPILFAKAITRLEDRQLKVTRKKAPPPEKTVTATGTGSADKTLDKLRAEAANTGDFSKVMQYRRKLKQ